MLHMGYLIILDGQSIKKISFRNNKQVVHPSLGSPPPPPPDLIPK